ncbi:MAG: helix-turn-helix transcriptional regulator [Candidatus Margulisbacteria bacterium]|nr:helix-turn-helix transcriptional regulator [Candidatus Margulisiibacteriota bacterium]
MARADIHFAPDKSILKAAAKVVRDERKKQGLTQESLAIKSGLHWRHIQRFETDKLNPSLCSFISLAKGLGINADDLIKRILNESNK